MRSLYLAVLFSFHFLSMFVSLLFLIQSFHFLFLSTHLMSSCHRICFFSLLLLPIRFLFLRSFNILVVFLHMFLTPAIPCLIFPCVHGPNSSAFFVCVFVYVPIPCQLSQWRQVVSTQRCGVTEIETPKLSTHIYVFICSSVAEI